VHVPKLCRHKHSGLAYVTDPADGLEVYLGPAGTPAAEDAYRAWVRAFLARPAGAPAPTRPRAGGGPLTVAGLLLRHLEWVERTYVKRDRPTSEAAVVRLMARVVDAVCGTRPAAEFGPEWLERVRAELQRRDYARSTANALLRRVRAAWRWAGAEGLVPRGLWHELASVGNLRKGRAGVREPAPVRPVPWATVEAVLPHLPATPRTMALLQWHTAMRPGEVCLLRPCDLDRSALPWLFVPSEHKKEHEGRVRQVWVGPRGRELLSPLLARTPADGWLFPGRRGGHYSAGSYRAVIYRACDAAGVAHFAPGRIRHSGATNYRREAGLDAAQGIMGHASARTTEGYATLHEDAARAAAERLG
jgi:integrase